MCAAGALAAAALLGVLAGVGSAPRGRPGGRASGSLESMFQDDRYLIYSPRATVTRTLDALRSLGVDRLRVTLLWSAIAPRRRSRPRRPARL